MISGISTPIDPNVLMGKAEQRFNNFDADQDGTLSEAELKEAFNAQEYSQQRIDYFLEKFDLDGSGTISQEEHNQVIKDSVQRVIDNQGGSGGGGQRPSNNRSLVEAHSVIAETSLNEAADVHKATQQKAAQTYEAFNVKSR